MDDPYADGPTSELPPVGGVPRWRSLPQRHFALTVAAAAVVAALATGGAVWAVSGSGVAPPMPVAAATPAPAGSAPAHKKAGAEDTVRGTVQAESGNTWTVRTRTGTTVTVTITSKTQFGTKKEPSSAAKFPVGAAVVVTGRGDDSAVTATRISAPAPASGTPSAGPTA